MARKTKQVFRAVVFCALGAACAEDAVLGGAAPAGDDASSSPSEAGGAETAPVEASACLGFGAACADAAACCVGSCLGGSCAPAICRLAGETCAVSAECCQADCDRDAGVCVDLVAWPCKVRGIGCATDLECCSRSCALPDDGGAAKECVPTDASDDGG